MAASIFVICSTKPKSSFIVSHIRQFPRKIRRLPPPFIGGLWRQYMVNLRDSGYRSKRGGKSSGIGVGHDERGNGALQHQQPDIRQMFRGNGHLASPQQTQTKKERQEGSVERLFSVASLAVHLL